MVSLSLFVGQGKLIRPHRLVNRVTILSPGNQQLDHLHPVPPLLVSRLHLHQSIHLVKLVVVQVDGHLDSRSPLLWRLSSSLLLPLLHRTMAPHGMVQIQRSSLPQHSRLPHQDQMHRHHSYMLTEERMLMLIVLMQMMRSAVLLDIVRDDHILHINNNISMKILTSLLDHITMQTLNEVMQQQQQQQEEEPHLQPQPQPQASHLMKEMSRKRPQDQALARRPRWPHQRLKNGNVKIQNVRNGTQAIQTTATTVRSGEVPLEQEVPLPNYIFKRTVSG
jgi:hypothetical protein